MNGLSAAIVRPSEDVRIHGNRIVEIIASESLKQRLGLDDGDTMTLSAEKAANAAYKDLFDFASSAGALEGFVYQKEDLDPGVLDNWIKNLVKQYEALPEDIRESIQAPLDRAVGRAVQSLTSLFGSDHGHVTRLKALVKGELPSSSDDFEIERAEKARNYP